MPPAAWRSSIPPAQWRPWPVLPPIAFAWMGPPDRAAAPSRTSWIAIRQPVSSMASTRPSPSPACPARRRALPSTATACCRRPTRISPVSGNQIQFVTAAVPQPGDTLVASFRLAGVTEDAPQLYPNPQVLCSGLGGGTNSSTLTSIGACNIPGRFSWRPETAWRSASTWSTRAPRGASPSKCTGAGRPYSRATQRRPTCWPPGGPKPR